MEVKDIKVVIISSWKEPTKAREVANSVDAKLLILPGEVKAMPGADGYISWINYIVYHLIEAVPFDNQLKKSQGQNKNRERKRGDK